MDLEALPGDGEKRDEHPELESRSFHGQLLSRSTKRPTEARRRAPATRPAPRAGWIGPFGQLVGQGATFAGGLAIGGGAMLLRRGEPLRASPGMLLFAGLACVFVAILAQLLAKGASKACPTTAGG